MPENIHLYEPPETEETAPSGSDARIARIQSIVSSYLGVVYDQLGAASQKEADDMRVWSQSLRTAEDVRDAMNMIPWMESAKSSAQRLHTTLGSTLDSAIAEKLISSDSKNRWMARFRDPMATYKSKEYFVLQQLPKYVENWRRMKERRTALLAHPKLKQLTLADVPGLAVLKDDRAFLALNHSAQENIIGMVSAALKGGETYGRDLYGAAKQKLERAVSRGAMSPDKVGVWLQRIFNAGQHQATIRAFVTGAGKQSLDTLINSWERVARRYDTVTQKMRASDRMGLKTQLIPREKFLQMHYEQRMSYVAEAERSLTASVNVKKEHPELLRIRHLLDIKDWDGADDAIHRAQHLTFARPEDASRLQSMRQYLREHRTDQPAAEPKKKEAAKEQTPRDKAEAALRKMREAMSEMDAPVRDLTERLAAYGEQSVNNVRWTFYNRIWCEKNGYLNSEKAQKGYDKNRDRSLQKARKGEDPGLHDPIETGEAVLIRKDEDQKKSKVRATIQYANLAEPNVIGRLAEWYKDRDPAILYWTTFVGHQNGRTMDTAWHMKHFVQLCEVRSALRTMRQSGFTYIPGGRLFDHTAGTPQ